MYDVLHECKKCLHNPVCGATKQYKNVREQICLKTDACVCSVIQVSVTCPHYMFNKDYKDPEEEKNEH